MKISDQPTTAISIMCERYKRAVVLSDTAKFESGMDDSLEMRIESAWFSMARSTAARAYLSAIDRA